MVDLNFALWHSGAKLSYLRYLTFKSLRHFHPHSRIQLFTTKAKVINKNCGQEFNDPNAIKVDYLPKLNELGVEIVETKLFDHYAPNFASDLFKWYYLYSNSGFYLDTDQIILKSFKSLPLKQYRFIYSSYKVNSKYAPNNEFSPVGVLGADGKSKIVKYIETHIKRYYDKNDYNSIGPWMMNDVIKKIDMSEGFNAPPNYFYPIPICQFMDKVYNGEFKIPKESFALHFYGGYDKSQIFNRKYTEEFTKISDDTISKFLREKKII
jgi:hypothetical protein